MNRTPNRNFARELPWGSIPKADPTRDFRIRQRDFMDVTQAQPVPLMAGTYRWAGIAMTPVFGLESREVSGAEGSK